MLFTLVLFGSLIGLVIAVFVISRNVEHGEARFDSESGKILKDRDTQPRGPVVPAQRIGKMEADEREPDDE